MRLVHKMIASYQAKYTLSLFTLIRTCPTHRTDPIFVERSVRDNGTKCFCFRELHAQSEETGFFVDEEHVDHLVHDHLGLLKQLQVSLDGRILNTLTKDL